MSDYVNATEASRMLGLSTPDYLLRLLRNGVVRGERVGREWRIERREIELRLARVQKKRSSVAFREENRAVQRAEIRDRFRPLVGRSSS